MKRNKTLSRLLAILLSAVLSMSLCLPAFAAGEEDTIYITTAAELCVLSDRCSLDTWSQGKTVVLMNDISLKGVSFEPIATFGGTFEGNGHTISGLILSDSFSPAGLFSTVQGSGVIRALNVQGQIVPSGEKKIVGGIAGRNYGTIESCTFFGTAKGDESVGGIAGRNEASGLIADCTVRGNVSASRYTGGIVGYNLGTIEGCINSASVNTASVDPSLNLEDISIDPASSLSDFVSVGAAESRTATSDTGGVAGYSSGSILSCTNRGTVGYPHVGYNVGGVAGRSGGYVSGCANHGVVYGRKDVGGIVGQMEPYLRQSVRSDLIAQLRTELDTLNDLTDRALRDAETAGDDVSSRLENISGYTDAAVDDADDIADQTQDFIDSTMDSVNDLSDRFDDVAQDLPDVLEAFEDAADAASHALAALRRANDSVNLSESERQRVEEAQKQIDLAISRLREILRTTLLPEIDWTNPDDLRALADSLLSAVGCVADIVSNTKTILEIYLKHGVTSISDVNSAISQALRELESASDSLSDAAARARRIIERLNRRGSVDFPTLGKDYSDRLDSLFSNLRGTVSELNALGDELGDNGRLLASDLRAVNDQLNVVFNLLLDAFLDVQDADASDLYEDISDQDIESATLGKVCESTNHGIVQADINVGGIAGAMAVEYELDPEDDTKEETSVFNRVYETRAIVLRCVNRGEVSAKKNCAGGIVGQMELGLAVSCEAYGSVESEAGNYIGGIAGLCATQIRSSWAKCRLTGGSYVGGIIGADSSNSLTDGTCSVVDCRSLVSITDYEQFAGAIAGRDGASFRSNYFVSDTLRGIDRVSRAGEAEPLSYEALTALKNVPADFLSFTVRFVADGETVKTVPFQYGDSLPLSVYPAVPDTDDSYHVWDITSLDDLRFDTTVTAEYLPYLDALQSGQTREDGRPVFFVEGKFQDGNTLLVNAETPQSDEFPQIGSSLKNSFAFLQEHTLPAMKCFRSVEEQWQLSFDRDPLAQHTVRYLSPNGRTSGYAAVFVRQPDGSWQSVKTQSMGSYLLFSVDGCEAEIAVVRTATVWWLWAAIIALAAAVVALMVTLIRRRKRKKAKPAANGENVT